MVARCRSDIILGVLLRFEAADVGAVGAVGEIDRREGRGAIQKPTCRTPHVVSAAAPAPTK